MSPKPRRRRRREPQLSPTAAELLLALIVAEAIRRGLVDRGKGRAR